ncbi:MAG TPA: hypothetical protein VGT78_13360 [Rhizomicrobium sp.]|nr:hypothetical protein [Rhizomicrobium sp.]
MPYAPSPRIQNALFAALRKSPPKRPATSPDALIALFGDLLAAPWERNPHLFDPLFRRYGIAPRDEESALKELIHAMARKHEPGFRPGRGRRKSQGITPKEWQAVLLYCYVVGDPQTRKLNANNVMKRIAEKIVMQSPTAKFGAIRSRYNRGKDAFAKDLGGGSNALKQLRIETIREIVVGQVGADTKLLAALARGKLHDTHK